MSRLAVHQLLALALASLLAAGCGAPDEGGEDGYETGGFGYTGGGPNGAGGTGGTVPGLGGLSTGGFIPTTGGTSTGGFVATTGGLGTGGFVATTGGLGTGGFVATTGGASTGGFVPTTGGTATGGFLPETGGTSTGGFITETGGVSTGGFVVETGGTETGGTETGGTETGGAETGGTETGGAPGTGGIEECSPVWDPPETANGNTNLPAGLDQVWGHSGDVIMAASNIKIRQVMAGGGSLKYCARWDSNQPISATDREQIEALIARCDRQWTDYLTGWGCWPYDEVQVEVVIWAVRDLSVLTGWSDDEGFAYVSSDASCPDDCGPWDPYRNFDGCSMTPFDEFFWLDGSLTDYTGWGSATGFYMGAEVFLSAARAGADTETIVAHEMGHSHGLDDFYDWQPEGWTNYVMLAGSSQYVTETDGWMLRDVWRHVRSDYGYPGP